MWALLCIMKLRPTWSEEFARPRGCLPSAEASSRAAELTAPAASTNFRPVTSIVPSGPSTTSRSTSSALVYTAQGKYADAEGLHQRALAIREKSLGADHPDVAQSLNNLALLYHDQGNYEQAAPLYQRALAICEKVLGPDHPNTVTTRKNYAYLLEQMKQKGKGQG